MIQMTMLHLSELEIGCLCRLNFHRDVRRFVCMGFGVQCCQETGVGMAIDRLGHGGRVTEC